MTGTFFFSRLWHNKKDPAGYETNGHRRRRRHSVVESSESYDASLFIIYLLFFFLIRFDHILFHPPLRTFRTWYVRNERLREKERDSEKVQKKKKLSFAKIGFKFL